MAKACLVKKQLVNKVPKTQSKVLIGRINEISKELVAGGESKARADVLAEAQALVELKAKSARSKWRLVNRVRVMNDLQAEFTGVAPGKAGRKLVKMVDDLDFNARAFHEKMKGDMGEALKEFRATITGKNPNPAGSKDLLKELHGESSGNPTAARMGKAINDMNEWARLKLNSYGHAIGKIDNWGLTHRHNPIFIGNAGFDKWSKDLLQEIDWAKTINPLTGIAFKSAPPPKVRDDFLKGIYNSVVYGRNSQNPKWMTSREGATLERHRSLAFKNADSWARYNEKYGGVDPHTAILDHINQMSRAIALAQKFGPDAEAAVDFAEQLIAKGSRDAGAGLKEGLKDKSGVSIAKGMVRVMEGGVAPNGWWGAQSARFFATTRKMLTSAMLDRAVVISVPSDLNSARLASSAIGMNPGNFMTTYTNLLADAVKGGGATRDDLLRAQHVAESWANPAVTSSRFQEEYPAAAWAEKLSNAAMRIQGLTAHTDSAKLAWKWSLSGQFASDAKKSFGDLDPLMRKTMQAEGITPAIWDTFRTSGGMFTASNGGTFLDPLMWHKTVNLPADEADRVFLAMQSFVEKWTERAVPSRSLIGQGVIDPKAYGLAPGSLPYEIMKSGTMFKSFPVAFVVNQTRMLSHHTGWGRAQYVIDLLGSTTIAGAIGIQVGDLLMGRDPQDMATPDFWLRSTIRGGGLGPVGDILSTGTASWGGGLAEYVAGPVVGATNDVFKLTLGNLAQAYRQAVKGDDIDVDLMQDLIRMQKRYTPMWQSPAALGGSALDRLFSDQLQLLLDPESAEDMAKASKKRKKDYGNGEWWMPGSPLPTRAPDLGTATGG